MWSPGLRDVTCCSHIVGIPPHQGADASRLSTHCRYNPDSVPQRGHPNPSTGATKVGGGGGGWEDSPKGLSQMGQLS